MNPVTEEELQRKRQEFRDQEVMSKITEYSAAAEYRHQTLKTNYTRRKVVTTLGPIGWTIIATQAVFLVVFSFLFVFSYLPKTKFLVAMVMP